MDYSRYTVEAVESENAETLILTFYEKETGDKLIVSISKDDAYKLRDGIEDII